MYEDDNLDMYDNGIQPPPFSEDRQEFDGASPEEQLAQTETQLASVTPSYAENIQGSRMQNGLAAIDAHVANGTINPQVGMQARTMIQQRLAPLMARRSQIPMYLARAQYQRLQLQNAQRSALMQQDQSFRARTAQQRLHSINTADGRTINAIEDSRGNLHFIPEAAIAGRQPQGPRPMTEVQRNAILREIEGDVDREMRDGALMGRSERIRQRGDLLPSGQRASGGEIYTRQRDLTPQERRAEIQQRYQERLQAIGATPQQSQQNTSSSASSPGEPATTQPTQTPQAVQMVQAVRENLRLNTNPNVRNDPGIQSRATELEQLIARYPSLRMPPAEERRAMQLIVEIRQRSGSYQPRTQQAPSRQVEPSPAAPRYGGGGLVR